VFTISLISSTKSLGFNFMYSIRPK